MKAVIFDWDGTIVNNTDTWLDSFNMALSEFNLNRASIEDFTRFTGGEYTKSKMNAFGVPLELKDDFVKKWVGNYSAITEKNGVKAYPKIRETIIKLRSEGYKTGIVTSGDKHRVLMELGRLGMGGIFDIIITREDFPHEKPHPGKLKLAAKRLGLPESDCVYVGDMDIDVLAAKACNMEHIAVAWGRNTDAFKNIGSEHIVDNIDDLYPKIKLLGQL